LRDHISGHLRRNVRERYDEEGGDFTQPSLTEVACEFGLVTAGARNLTAKYRQELGIPFLWRFLEPIP
jgi:hypothetical protein